MNNRFLLSIGTPPIEVDLWDEWQWRNGSPFHSTHFLSALKSLGWEGVYAAEVRDGKMVQAATCLCRFVPQRFSQWTPLRWSNIFDSPSALPGATSDFLPWFLESLRKQGVAFVQTSGSMPRFRPAEIEIVKTSLGGVSVEPFGTFELPLDGSEEDLWGQVHSKHRNSVRAAEKLGVTIFEKGPDFENSELELFYDMLETTLHRGGTGTPSRDYFVAIATSLLKGGFAKLFVAKSQSGELISFALIPMGLKRGYYWMGASKDPRSIPAGAGNLIQWKIMMSLRAAGTDVYDFGGARPDVAPGSKLEHIQNFKKRFGGQFVPYSLWQADLKPIRGPVLRAAKRISSFLVL